MENLTSLNEKILANSFYGGYYRSTRYPMFVMTPVVEECDNTQEILAMRSHCDLKDQIKHFTI